MKTELPYSVSAVIIRAALHKLNECRSKYPEIDNNINTMNLRFLLERNEADPDCMIQAAYQLASLSESLEIEASNEVAALTWAALHKLKAEPQPA